MDQVPAAYKQAGLFMLISGIMHLMVGALLVLSGLVTCLGTYGLCCFCPGFGVVPMAVGVHELFVASQMQQGRWLASARGTNLSSLIVGVMSMSMVNIVLEALAMAQLSQPDVVAFLEQGGTDKLDRR